MAHLLNTVLQDHEKLEAWCNTEVYPPCAKAVPQANITENATLINSATWISTSIYVSAILIP